MRRDTLRQDLLTAVGAAVAVFLSGVAVAGTHLSKGARPFVGQPFVMEFRQVYRDAVGNEQLQATGMRWQASNGAWKSVTNYVDREGNVYHTLTTYSVPGRGVYTVRDGKLVYVSEAMAARPGLSMSEMRRRAGFVREDKVLGYDAAVVKTGNGADMVSQAFVVPLLQGLPVKFTDLTPSGEGTTMEPMRIELREPPGDTFRLPNLPEDHSYYRQKQAETGHQ